MLWFVKISKTKEKIYLAYISWKAENYEFCISFPDIKQLDTLSEVYGLCTQVTEWDRLRWGHMNGIKEMISKGCMWKMSSEPGLEG